MEDPDTDTDPESEWIIEECSSKENSGKFRWILNKGLSVGKKMLLTGFVISSAPIVLPPLAVVSIIGFACSFPYGLFLASYACTNKLMSKLLPESLPHSYVLEYGTVSSTDEQVENENDEYGGDGEDLGVYGDINRDKEDQGMWEDTSKCVEMRIELVENDQGDEWMVLVGSGYGEEGFRNDEQELVDDLNEIVKKDGYEEDVGEYVGEDEEETTRISYIEEMGIGMPFEARNYFANVKWKKHLREIECRIDENENDETSKERYAPYVDVIPKEMEPKPVFGDLLAWKESDQVLEAEKSSGEMSGTTHFGFAKNVDVVPMEMQPKPVVGVSGAEISTGEMSGTTDVGSNLAEEQKAVACKPYMSQRGRANDNITNVVQQNFRLIKKKEIVLISSNADARKIADEMGFDLFDNNNVGAQPYSYEGEQDNNITVISSQKDVSMASNKVFLTEEKIWEKIEAMRTIVGYKAARQATCLEELKALYFFTGVEPPASFKDPCTDLMEVNNEKLRFLMSIVGVK
ncbi:hypothetical protein Dsin_001096 [Dipteronia sinensis]|uniref:Uncharacterized protein n=1 Tax=Dipteronia sinensis TaxID=43782 RepID=A0AAE0B4K6_9ROSI|nr:hypothetical protein Dsin_001096 [Dipteronia sinensis]